jgi:hypothetical protein
MKKIGKMFFFVKLKYFFEENSFFIQSDILFVQPMIGVTNDEKVFYGSLEKTTVRKRGYIQ